MFDRETFKVCYGVVFLFDTVQPDDELFQITGVTQEPVCCGNSIEVNPRDYLELFVENVDSVVS